MKSYTDCQITTDYVEVDCGTRIINTENKISKVKLNANESYLYSLHTSSFEKYLNTVMKVNRKESD